MTGVQIGEYHTFRDWGLYLISVDISLPQKKEYKISLPAGNGELDFSDALTGGEPKFYNRPINMNFEAETADDEILFLKASEIANIIHGRKENIIFDDDRGFYYTGICSVIFNRKNPMITSFSISMDAEPFKYETVSSMENWEWDSFNFFTGVIRELVDIDITEQSNTVKILGGIVSQVPIIWVNGVVESPFVVSYKGREFNLKKGRNRFPQIYIGKEDAVLTFKGKGNVSIEYRGASL